MRRTPVLLGAISRDLFAVLLGGAVALLPVFAKDILSASNELGAFESGVAAALLGAVPAVVIGGVLTVAIAFSWTRFFPALAHVDRLDALRPTATAVS